MGGVSDLVWARLPAAKRAVAERVIAEESARREHLVVALSGSHAFGFATPESDVDLKAVHLAPSEALLGLDELDPTANRLGAVDGVAVDYTSNELGAVLRGILRGNGNFVERVLGATALTATGDLDALREVTRGALSRRVHRHYHGFATGQGREFAQRPSAKSLLHALRTALTGARLLRTGELVAELDALLDDDGFDAARAVLAARRAGEAPALDVARWRGELARAMEVLDAAERGSALPAEPRDPRAAQAWLVSLRRARLG